MQCITARAEHNFVLAPNQSATKAAWMLKNYPVDERRNIRIGTVDTWIASVLSNGELHVTDTSNAAVTGLLSPDSLQWSPRALELMQIDIEMMPRVVTTSGIVGNATALPGAPPTSKVIGLWG